MNILPLQTGQLSNFSIFIYFVSRGTDQCPRYTIRTDISEGETPLIREA